MNHVQVDPQLTGHLRGALKNGTTVEEVKAVREIVIEKSAASGMVHLPEGVTRSGGSRSGVANL